MNGDDGAIELVMVGVLYVSVFFFFNDTATTEIYTLSLHDALPIWPDAGYRVRSFHNRPSGRVVHRSRANQYPAGRVVEIGRAHV